MATQSYFDRFPSILYDFSRDGIEVLMSDITHRARIRKILDNNLFVYYEWDVPDGDSPEIIAYKYYGDTKYFWVVMFSNDIFDRYYDWVQSDEDLNAYIISRYGSLPTAKQTLHHYEDSDGDTIDHTTFITDGGEAISAYDYYASLNESKRRIKLLDKQYLAQVERELTIMMTDFLNK